MPTRKLCKQQQQQHSHSLSILSNPCSDFGSFIGGNGGLFLEPTIPDSFVRFLSSRIPTTHSSEPNSRRRRRCTVPVGCFMSVSLPAAKLSADKESTSDGVVQLPKVRVRRGNAVNTTKHLWAGAVAAMVSRYS